MKTLTSTGLQNGHKILKAFVGACEGNQTHPDNCMGLGDDGDSISDPRRGSFGGRVRSNLIKAEPRVTIHHHPQRDRVCKQIQKTINASLSDTESLPRRPIIADGLSRAETLTPDADADATRLAPIGGWGGLKGCPNRGA